MRSRHQEIDAKIQSLEREITALRRERNTLLPSHTLPDELLLRIFATLRETASSSGTPGNAFRWVQASTHVCTHWRTLALSSHVLWAYIDFSNSSLVREMLRRSAHAPLHLFVHPLFRHSNSNMNVNMNMGMYRRAAVASPLKHAVLNEALGEMQRIAGLDVGVTGSWYAETIFPALAPSYQWPLLRELSLRYSSPAHGFHDPPVFSVAVLRALAANLEHLALDGFKWGIGEKDRDDGTIELPVLKSLWLRNLGSRCTELLRIVSIPVTANLNLLYWDSDISDRAESGLSQFLAHFWEQRSYVSQIIQGLRVDPQPPNLQDNRNRVRIDFYADADMRAATPPLRIILSSNDSAFFTPELDSVVCTLLEEVPLQNVRALEVGVLPFEFGRFWEFIAGACPYIQCLSFSISISSFSTFLLKVQGSDSSSGSTNNNNTAPVIPFLSLKRLRARDVGWIGAFEKPIQKYAKSKAKAGGKLSLVELAPRSPVSPTFLGVLKDNAERVEYSFKGQVLAGDGFRSGFWSGGW